MKKGITILCLALILFGSPLKAISGSEWMGAGVQLNGERGKILQSLGMPDTIDTGTELYFVSDSPEITLGMIEYKNEKACVVGEIYQASVSFQDLVAKQKQKGLTATSETAEAAVFIDKLSSDGGEYYVVINPSEAPDIGPTLTKMTVEAFNEEDLKAMEQGSDQPDSESTPSGSGDFR